MSALLSSRRSLVTSPAAASSTVTVDDTRPNMLAASTYVPGGTPVNRNDPAGSEVDMVLKLTVGPVRVRPAPISPPSSGLPSVAGSPSTVPLITPSALVSEMFRSTAPAPAARLTSRTWSW